jgi:hypothetical protein
VVDLDAAGHRLAEWDAGPITPAAQILVRARARRRHRALGKVAAVAVAFAAAAAGLVAVVAGRSTNQRVVVGPVGLPVTIPTAPHPKGWTLVQIGLLEFWEPVGGSCSSQRPPQAAIVLPGAGCSSGAGPTSTTPVVITPISAPVSGTFALVNDVDTYRSQHGAILRWAIPAFGVQVEGTAGVGQQIVDTMTASPLEALLSTRYPVEVPSLWKGVSFGGVEARVPPDWVVQTLDSLPNKELSIVTGKEQQGACSLFNRAEVLLGNPPGSCQGNLGWSSEPDGTPVPGLWLGQSYLGSTAPVLRSTTIHSGHATIDVAWGPFDTNANVLGLRIHTAKGTVNASLGLGADPVVAEEILSSVTAAP